MKVLTDKLQMTLVEAKELEVKMAEFKDGLKAQINSILSGPPMLKPRTTTITQTRRRIPNLIDLESSQEYN